MSYRRAGPRFIPVKWHGCHFRSKLEAQWAIVFELMGLEWSYEPGGFKEGSLSYIPDFFVCGLEGRGGPSMFVEVKGDMTDVSRRKIRMLAKRYPVYVVGSIPWDNCLFDQLDKWSEDDDFHSFKHIDGDSFGAAIGINTDGYPELFGDDGSYMLNCDTEVTQLIFQAACYARFDHGETPNQQSEYRLAHARVGMLKKRSKSKRKDRHMPRLSQAWNAIQENTGTFSDIEPGAYVLTVTKVEPHESQQYAIFYWDVAEGPCAGAYAQSQWPPSDRIYWTDKALGILKHKMHVLADSNPTFQPTVAFDNDNWQAFVGKRFGAVVRKRLYTAGPNAKNPGEDREAVEIAAWITPEQVASGDFRESLLQPRDMRESNGIGGGQVVTTVPSTYQPVQQSSDMYDTEIPF